ncbi:MAG: hypothetical protein MK171_14250, partial [Pirellulales bacterium]|nr:hypothetical protein [Pirellulales bacterium]
MDQIAGRKSALVWATHFSVVALVLLWLFPTVGLLVSSFRSLDDILASGWWSSLSTVERQQPAIRLTGDELQDGDLFVIEGELFASEDIKIQSWGTSSREPEALAPGETSELSRDRTVTLSETGAFRLTGVESFEGQRMPRVFTTAVVPPSFTGE